MPRVIAKRAQTVNFGMPRSANSGRKAHVILERNVHYFIKAKQGQAQLFFSRLGETLRSFPRSNVADAITKVRVAHVNGVDEWCAQIVKKPECVDGVGNGQPQSTLRRHTTAAMLCRR